jgi:type II secretory pathway component GspD/PulD (secretin)
MKKTINAPLLFVILIAGAVSPLYTQHIRSMDFRNRPISDILMALADTAQTSIIVDETVSGNATFHFSESEFADALQRFTSACHLYAVERENVWYVSRILISSGDKGITVSAEDTDVEQLVRALSRTIGVTILYDQLPRNTITVFGAEMQLQDLLEIIVKKYPEYSILNENGSWYIHRQGETTSQSAGSRLSSSSIRVSDDLYSVNIQRANFSAVISLLFRTGKKEYSMLVRNETALENLYFENKTFEEVLRIICEQGNCDFTVTDDVYYIFEVQRRDIIKRLKDIRVIELRNLSISELNNLMPAEYSASSFIKTAPQTNSIYLTGSSEEIDPIASFVEFVDNNAAESSIKIYKLRYIKGEEFIKLLPKNLADLNPLVVSGTNSVLVTTNNSLNEQFEKFISFVDKVNVGIPIKLKYINSEELIKSLPPSVSKDDITVTIDPTLVFYTGPEEKQILFNSQLLLLDQPKPQIRYQILVIQYQKSDNFQWDPSISVNPTALAEHISGNFSNLLNVNFDIISTLGHRFASQLNMQIGENKARVLADTTLNGISGQEIKFENTTTFRYTDVAGNPETSVYTGTTREINSGLSLDINGWVSGDGMITMQVNATVSKQDEAQASATNPPPTSERSVNTQVRTRSGTPIIISGLMQIEKSESTNKLPILGYIPLLGKLFQKKIVSDVFTEMAIYIIPYLHNSQVQQNDYDRKNKDYLHRYVGDSL